MDDKELKLLRDKCLLYNQYMVEKNVFPKEVLPAFEESNRIIEEYYQKGFTKGIKGDGCGY